MNIKSSIKKVLPESWVKKRKKHIENRIMYKDCKETFLLGKKQIHSKSKITVVFVVYMPEVWNSCKSIYEFAAQDERFEAYIFAQPKISTLGQQQNALVNEAYEYLSKEYEGVINAYDSDNKVWFDMTILHPDYVFYTRPYNPEYYSLYKPEYVRNFAKVCLLSYGYDLTDDEITLFTYNIDFLRYCAIVFATSSEVQMQLKKRFFREVQKGYIKIEYLGFARFDLLNKREKRKNEKIKILWTPRWTADDDTGHMKSNFLKYRRNFFEYIKKNSEYELVVRPHPLMFPNYVQKGIMTKEEVEGLIAGSTIQKNIKFDLHKDYMVEANDADIFVTDFTSLMIEFFATGKPVIYCDETEAFYKDCKEMIPFLYQADTWDDIEKLLEKMKDNRRYLDVSGFKLFPKNMGKIGKDILQYIADDLKGYNK